MSMFKDLLKFSKTLLSFREIRYSYVNYSVKLFKICNEFISLLIQTIIATVFVIVGLILIPFAPLVNFVVCMVYAIQLYKTDKKWFKKNNGLE